MVDNFSNNTVMLIDDDKMFRGFLNQIISLKIGAKVVQANNPKEGFEILKKQVPDLLILDMEMPMMDGFTTLKYIRSIKKLTNLPVIACTALRKEELVIALSKLKIVDFIEKRTDANIIYDKIRTQLMDINYLKLIK